MDSTNKGSFDAAVRLHMSGRIREAIAGYLQLLPLQPGNAQLLYLLGTAHLQAGQLGEGISRLQASLAIEPRNADALNNMGIAQQHLGRPDEALASYDRALSVLPDNAESHNNRGVVLKDLGRYEEALASFDRALAIRPNYDAAWYNRGTALQDLKRYDEALASYDQALSIRPGYAEAHNNRGTCLQELGRPSEAVASYDRGLAIQPGSAETYNNRGVALKDLGRLDEAIASYDRALAIRDDYADAHANRGIALQELERHHEALASYERAQALKPHYDYLFGLALHARMKLCDWHRLDEALQDLTSRVLGGETVTSPFPLLGLVDDPGLHLAASELYAASKFQRPGPPPAFPTRPPGARIRVGYYSADFHNHATAWLMAELFEAHDRERFEVYGFSFGPPSHDEMRQRVSAAFHDFIDVTGKSDREVAQLSGELGIDVAVDLKGYTSHSRPGIFAARCAPVQVSYLGFPGTMGMPAMDYIVADATLVPEASRRYYSEKVACLPHSYQVNDSQRKISDRVFSRAEAGLPGEGFVFCCFNGNFKLLPATFDSWMRILKAVAGSVLWLMADNPTVMSNLRKEAAARGVDEARLVFATRMKLDDHLARHRLADLFLDTLPYNAHTTTSDALWAGLPVLTLQGQSFAARVAASLLEAVGLPELITTSREQYELKAIELARDPEMLRDVRTTLARNRLTSPLFDGRLFARHIEAAYTQMVERHRAGLRPDHLHVEPVAGHQPGRAVSLPPGAH